MAKKKTYYERLSEGIAKTEEKKLKRSGKLSKRMAKKGKAMNKYARTRYVKD